MKAHLQLRDGMWEAKIGGVVRPLALAGALPLALTRLRDLQERGHWGRRYPVPPGCRWPA
jgi:hypothetical protein